MGNSVKVRNVWSAAITGVLGCVIILLISTLLISVFINSEQMDLGSSKVALWIVHGLASFLCAFLCNRLCGHKMILATTTGICCYMTLLVGTAIVAYDGVGKGVVSSACACLIGGLVGVILCNRNKKSSHTIKRKKSFR